MNEIYAQGVAQSRKKKIYDTVYRIEAKKARQANVGLLEYKSHVERVRLGVQAQYLELFKRDEEEETCPNYGVKSMRVRTRPRLPFLEVINNTPPRPEEGQPKSSSEGMHVN